MPTSANRLDGFVEAAARRLEAGYYHTRGEPMAGTDLRGIEGIIAELKPRSPSQGRLQARPTAEILRAFVLGDAQAISCLTDPDHFDGSLENLRAAAATGRPVLMKDFIIDKAQIDCAAHHGAGGVLLIARILTRQRRDDLIRHAKEQGLATLLEVAHGDDAEAAARSDADLVGVNARDLETLAVDVEGTLGAIAALRGAGKHVVALSGIKNRDDVRRAVEAGASAVLVGTSLMAAPRPHLVLRGMQRPLAKICGIKDPMTLQAAAVAGADLVGFVVGSPDSPRNISTMAAQRLREAARGLGLAAALVTREQDPWKVRDWCRIVRPDFVQVHGWQPDEEWRHAVAAHDTHVLQAIGPGEGPPDTPFIVDNVDPGSGKPVDWDAAHASIQAAADRLSLIAGGLDASNVHRAIASTGAWGADASSGLESRPGIKDAAKMRAYVMEVQAAP